MLQFEWDREKATQSFQKHGVSFDEAATVFGDLFSLTVPDPLHSMDESRFVTIGQSHKGRTIVVVHCDRGDRMRIVTARLATRREKRVYEEG